MTMSQTLANVNPDQLFQGVKRLQGKEFDAFAKRVSILAAQRRIPNRTSERESELLHYINRGLPQKTLLRYRELSEKDEEQTSLENQEILAIIRQMEQLAIERLGYVIELAALRNTTPLDIMRELKAGAVYDW